jgi:predicted O-methyltransferase YrrM
MGLIKFAREVMAAPHYRSSPAAILQYAYAKWVFFRSRQNDPMKFLQTIGIDPGLSLRGFDRWRLKLEQATDLLRKAEYGQGGVSFEDGLILYALVRALQPDYVVETGVAAGVSTSFFGAALIENNRGDLFSIELPPAETSTLAHADGSRYSWQEQGVGWVIPNEIKLGLASRHHLILRDVRRALPDLLQQIPYVDIFFHDDLHTPDHMIWEYELVWSKMRPGGLLVSDDVNHGWIKFCRKRASNGTALQNVDRLCALRKPGEGIGSLA